MSDSTFDDDQLDLQFASMMVALFGDNQPSRTQVSEMRKIFFLGAITMNGLANCPAARQTTGAVSPNMKKLAAELERFRREMAQEQAEANG